MPKQKVLYFTKCEIDGRCLALLLTEKEIVQATKRAELKENQKYLAGPLQNHPNVHYGIKYWGDVTARSNYV